MVVKRCDEVTGAPPCVWVANGAMGGAEGVGDE
jgi:hypothetical protein